MKITKNQLRRIIREEKQKLLAESSPADMSMHGAADYYEKKRFTTDNRDFLDGMKTVIAGLMALPPETRILNAESLIQNIEIVIDAANKEMVGI